MKQAQVVHRRVDNSKPIGTVRVGDRDWALRAHGLHTLGRPVGDPARVRKSAIGPNLGAVEVRRYLPGIAGGIARRARSGTSLTARGRASYSGKKGERERGQSAGVFHGL